MEQEIDDYVEYSPCCCYCRHSATKSKLDENGCFQKVHICSLRNEYIKINGLCSKYKSMLPEDEARARISKYAATFMILANKIMTQVKAQTQEVENVDK